MSIQSKNNKIDNDVVLFRDQNDLNVVARLREIRGNLIAFEHFSSSAIYESSDLIEGVKIEMGGEMAFQGDLRVKAAISLSGIIVYEGQLEGTWTLPRFSGEKFLNNAAEFLEEHTVAWARKRDFKSSFLTVVSDLEIYLDGLESWCQQVESGSLRGAKDREEKILNEVSPIVSLEIASHFEAYEKEVLTLQPEQRAQHRAELMRSLHRFILQSPFSDRCFAKPLGYAGDYGMVELMLGNPYQGRSLFAKLLNNAFLETGPVKAHQNRILYLVDNLREIAKERAERGLRTRILNLGCGPADEVRRFIETEEVAESCDFELLDFSAVTLEYTREKIAKSREHAGREVNVELIEQSIQGFLKQAARGQGFQAESYDYVYCAGLFDYLTQGFCAKLTSTLYDLAKPGGLVVVTNVSKHNTIPAVMEDFLEWSIIDRCEDEMWELVPSGKSGLLKELKSDITRINLFLELRKPAAQGRDVGANETIDEGSCKGSRVSRAVRGGRSARANSQL